MEYTSGAMVILWIVFTGLQLLSFVKGQCTNATYPLELIASNSPQYISSPDYPGTYPANSSCAWRITAPTNSYIILNVENITLSETTTPGLCVGEDTLTVFDGYNETSTVLSQVCPTNEDDVNSLFPTSDTVFITFTSESSPFAGFFNILYFSNGSQPDCNMNDTITRYASSITGTLMSPSATDGPVSCNITFLAHLDNTFTFTIYYMNLLGGDCSTSSLIIYDGDSLTDTLLHQSCTRDTVYTFSNITTTNTSAFLVLDIPQGNYAMLLTYYTNPYTNNTCDRSAVPLTAVFNTENYIESENFGTSKYSNRLRCRWLITAQNGSMAVEVYFDNSTFNLEYSYYCSYDYVIIYDGSTASYSNQINKFCGSSVPEGTYRTTGTEMLVFFRTDYAIKRDGFRLIYKAVENNCDSLFTEYDATYNINTNSTDFLNISSPNYNIGDYPRNSDVYWLFTNINYTTHRIVVEIKEIKIERATNCIYDRVVAYNGSCITDEIVDVACGSRRVRFDLYNERHLVRFVSDGILEYEGFYAHYYVIPLPTPIPPTTTTVKNGPALEVVVDTINELLTNYSTENLPTRVLNDSINATIDFYLVGINGLDENDQILTMTGQFVVTWTDGNIAWDPTKRSDMQLVLMPQNDIWRPDIVLMNGVNKITAMGASFMFIVADYNGSCTWRPYQVLESTCQVDMTKYPYDRQSCYLVFGTWSSSESEVRTDFAGDGMKIHEKFTENSVWRLADYKTSEETINSQRAVKFTLILERNPAYVTVYITIPLVMLAYINAFTFTIPAGSGEKSGFAITVFLSFVVVLIVVSDSIPRNSENISLFATYILTMTMMSGLATCITVAQIRVMTLELHKYHVPEVLTRAVIFTTKLTYKVTCFRKTDNEDTSKGKTENGEMKSDKFSGEKQTKSPSPEEAKENNVDIFSRYKDREYSWLEDDVDPITSLDDEVSYYTGVSKELNLNRELTTGSIQLVKENTNVDIQQNSDDMSENGSAMFSDEEDEAIEEIIRNITDETNKDSPENQNEVEPVDEYIHVENSSPPQYLEEKDSELKNDSTDLNYLPKSAKNGKRVTFKDEAFDNNESNVSPSRSSYSFKEVETGIAKSPPGILRAHTDPTIRLNTASPLSGLDRSNTVSEIVPNDTQSDQNVTQTPQDNIVDDRSSNQDRPASRSASRMSQKSIGHPSRPESRLSTTGSPGMIQPGSRTSRSDSRISYTSIASQQPNHTANDIPGHPFATTSMPFPLPENQPFSIYDRESRMSEYYPITYTEMDPYDWEITSNNQNELSKDLSDEIENPNDADDKESVSDNEVDGPEVTWEDVVNCSDVYLFIGYLIVTTLITVAFFGSMLTA